MIYGWLDFVRRAATFTPPDRALGARSAVWARFLPGEYEDREIRPWIKIIWSLAGEGSVRIERKIYSLPAGKVAVFFPGMRHEAWMDRASSGHWEARWITMDGPLCGSFAQAVGLRRAGIFQPKGNLKPLFDRYREGIAATTPDGARKAELAAHELLAGLGAGVSVGKTDSVIEEAMSLLRLHWPEKDFGVNQVAQHIGVDRSILSRRFRAETGMPPLIYLTNLRLGNALTLLRSTTLSIREVAFQCGFADPGYFIRLFRKSQGVTPGRFRQSGN